jgi:hypothetical protein
MTVHLPSSFLRPWRSVSFLQQTGNLGIQSSILAQQWQQSLVRQQHCGAQGNGPRSGSRHHSAAHAAYFSNPGGNLISVAYRCRQQQQPDARRRQDDRLLPNVTAILIPQIVGFVEHNEISIDVAAAA